MESLTLLEDTPALGQLGFELRARVMNQRGFALSQSGDFAGAMVALDQAVDLASASGMAVLRAEIEINGSGLFFYLGDYDQLEECARVALRIAEEEHHRQIEAGAVSGCGKAAMLSRTVRRGDPVV